MPAYRSWFRVSPAAVCSQAQACVAALESPENTRAVVDLSVVGLDGARFRLELSTATRALSDALVDQAAATDALDEARGDARRLAAVAHAWRARLIARLRFAATRGADPVGSFAKTFRYRACPRPRVAGVLRELEVVFTELERHRATLAPHGVGAAFISEGRVHFDGLRRAADAVEAANHHRKACTRRVASTRQVVEDALLQLVAADEAAALDAARAPVFTLDQLDPAAT